MGPGVVLGSSTTNRGPPTPSRCRFWGLRVPSAVSSTLPDPGDPAGTPPAVPSCACGSCRAQPAARPCPQTLVPPRDLGPFPPRGGGVVARGSSRLGRDSSGSPRGSPRGSPARWGGPGALGDRGQPDPLSHISTSCPCPSPAPPHCGGDRQPWGGPKMSLRAPWRCPRATGGAIPPCRVSRGDRGVEWAALPAPGSASALRGGGGAAVPMVTAMR